MFNSGEGGHISLVNVNVVEMGHLSWWCKARPGIGLVSSLPPNYARIPEGQ
jgi:hypothetical protein